MSELKNIKHEQFAQEYVGGKTQKGAYKVVYPVASDNTASSNSNQLLNTREDVRKRCLEILQNTEGLRLTSQLDKLKDLSEADKKIAVDKVLATVQDNPTRLEATKTILRLYGLLTTHSRSQIDARSLHFNISGGEIDRLAHITERLERLEGKTSRISGKK